MGVPPKRRGDHKATLFFKMKNNLVPHYLSSLVPPTVGSASRYNRRNADNLQNINTKTALYSNSFLPSAVRNRNDLPSEAKQIDSINSFKYFLARERERAPVYYYTDKRLCQTRKATDKLLQSLKLLPVFQTYNRLTILSLKTQYHYFFECRMYAHQRILLFYSISLFHVITLNLYCLVIPLYCLQKTLTYLTKYRNLS